MVFLLSNSTQNFVETLALCKLFRYFGSYFDIKANLFFSFATRSCIFGGKPHMIFQAMPLCKNIIKECLFMQINKMRAVSFAALINKESGCNSLSFSIYFDFLTWFVVSYQYEKLVTTIHSQTWVWKEIFPSFYFFLKNTSRNPAVKLPPITPIHPIRETEWKPQSDKRDGVFQRVFSDRIVLCREYVICDLWD